MLGRTALETALTIRRSRRTDTIAANGWLVVRFRVTINMTPVARLRPWFLYLFLAAATAGAAEPAPIEQSNTFRTEIELLCKEQQKSAVRMAEFEAKLGARNDESACTTILAATRVVLPSSPAEAVSESGAITRASAAERLDVSGDLRLRYEFNTGDTRALDTAQASHRVRLRAANAFTPWLTLGGQMTTSDLKISLDQAYARFGHGKLILHAGRIPNPFLRTDLVWDADVSPHGVSATIGQSLGADASIKAAGLHFLIDESVAGPDSSMLGAQLSLDALAGPLWEFQLAASYFDYSLSSVARAGAGALRSNRAGPGGTYLSDFNLVDSLASVTYHGLGSRWPVRLVGNVVTNLGANDENDGYGADLVIGRFSRSGDWRIGYGYSAADADAVLAAFSHDNTTIGANYVQHVLTIDYLARKKIVLNGTLYAYRPRDPRHAGASVPLDWLERLRLNLLVSF